MAANSPSVCGGADFVRPERRHDEDRPADRFVVGGRQHCQSPAVRPVHVVEDDRQRSAVGGRAEPRPDGAVQPEAPRGGIGPDQADRVGGGPGQLAELGFPAEESLGRRVRRHRCGGCLSGRGGNYNLVYVRRSVGGGALHHSALIQDGVFETGERGPGPGVDGGEPVKLGIAATFRH